MSSCSSSTPLENSLTGCKLADLEVLTVAPHETFISLLLTSKRFNQLATGECRNQLYEGRVRLHMPEFVPLAGVFPLDENNKWKEVYDSLVTLKDNQLTAFFGNFSSKYNRNLVYIHEGIIEILAFDTELRSSLCVQLDDAYFYTILALNELSKLNALATATSGASGRTLIQAVLHDPEILVYIFYHGALRLLKWIDSIGLLERAMTYHEDSEYPIHTIIGSGHLDMLKWVVLEKGYDLMAPDLAAFENGKSETANVAVRHGHVHMLDWLKEQGYRPDHRGAVYIVEEVESEDNNDITPKMFDAVFNWLENDGTDILEMKEYVVLHWHRTEALRPFRTQILERY